MSYDYRKIYNVAEAAGCEISSNYTYAKNLERVNAVKVWFDENYGDIFETKAEGNGTVCYLNAYFKGTRSGIFISQYTTMNNSNTAMGIIQSETRVNAATNTSAGYLAQSTVKLLVIKSKYGVIAGFFKENISNNVRAAAINMGNRFISVMIHNTGVVYISDGSGDAVTTALTRSGQTDDVFLLKFLPPTLDEVCGHAFWNMGSSTNDCIVYGIGSGEERYAELQGVEGYNTVALELAEPSAEDFAGITPFWS